MSDRTNEKKVYGEGWPAAGDPIPESKILDSQEFKDYAEMVMEEAIRRLKEVALNQGPSRADGSGVCKPSLGAQDRQTSND